MEFEPCRVVVELRASFHPSIERVDPILTTTSFLVLGLTTAFGATYKPESDGALGDGRRDDTAAIRRAYARCDPGDVLELASGKVYKTSARLLIDRPGVTISGSGATIRAGNPGSAALFITGANTTIRGLTVEVERGGVGRTGDNDGACPFNVHRASGVTLEDCVSRNSLGAGMFFFGATHFRVARGTVVDSLADAYHCTAGSASGEFLDCLATNPGDDGFAVVSYAREGEAGRVHDIHYRSCKLQGQSNGRGICVVGGSRITHRDVTPVVVYPVARRNAFCCVNVSS